MLSISSEVAIVNGARAAQELHEKIHHWVVSTDRDGVVVRTNRAGFDDEVTVCVYCGNDEPRIKCFKFSNATESFLFHKQFKNGTVVSN